MVVNVWTWRCGCIAVSASYSEARPSGRVRQRLWERRPVRLVLHTAALLKSTDTS